MDYADGLLSDQEKAVVEEYLANNPNELQVVQGIKQFYDFEQADRTDLGTYLAEHETDIDFLFTSNENPDQDEILGLSVKTQLENNHLDSTRRFSINKRHIWVAVACWVGLFANTAIYFYFTSNYWNGTDNQSNSPSVLGQNLTTEN
ncbi:MAG: hypothetical protein AAF223_03130, partial [Bacteroidota bacterium]